MVNMTSLFGGSYEGEKVLITGHTGFKGSWLALWLSQMGAKVYGYALDPPSDPSHIDKLDIDLDQRTGDIRDIEKLSTYINKCQPAIVFHLAAQSLVRRSYAEPVETISTNVMGTLNVFEACRKTPSVRAIVNVTSDKCYQNKEWIWGYRENDPMGGYDPYSASKGMAELLNTSYRNSYFNPEEYGKSHHVLLASARAGNVIGGGDWAEDRLIPDMMRAASKNEIVEIRNPLATRPWQHVLEPLSGYLTLGWHLLNGHQKFAEGWNFGPGMDSNISVAQVVEAANKYWSKIEHTVSGNPEDYHEANLLMLDCSKASKLLKWTPVWGFEQTIDKTISWYRNYYQNGQVNSAQDIIDYVAAAREKYAVWMI